MTCPGLVVAAESGDSLARARELAEELGAGFADTVPDDGSLCLSVGPGGISLRSGNLAFKGDFTTMARRLRAVNLSSELLIKAARIKNASMPLSVFDATAGMGEDSFLLAAAGYEVTLYEHNPVVGALLKDALARARTLPETSDAAGRMRAFVGDSVSAIQELERIPDIIYLDPMFPERRKSAAVKKKFQLIHLIETTAGEGGDILRSAIEAGPRKIIVKRPAGGPLLGGIRPSYSLQGKTVRYDVILPAAVRAGNAAEGTYGRKKI